MFFYAFGLRLKLVLKHRGDSRMSGSRRAKRPGRRDEAPEVAGDHPHRQRLGAGLGRRADPRDRGVREQAARCQRGASYFPLRFSEGKGVPVFLHNNQHNLPAPRPPFLTEAVGLRGPPMFQIGCCLIWGWYCLKGNQW